MGVELAGFQKQRNIYVLLLGKITADSYSYLFSLYKLKHYLCLWLRLNF
jgi:hypothetical protein